MEFDGSKKYMVKREAVMLKCQHVFRNEDVCGYEWLPVHGEPKKCPKCQHFDWRGEEE